eukprot:sb/3467237/
MASDSGGSGGGSYRGWLGGYAKSMAGSVSAFTADILEETRADSTGMKWGGSHGFTSNTHAELLAVSSKLEKKDSKIKSLEGEIQLLKEQLRDGAETQEVLEIQLQEVAGRWKAVLSEKDVELKGLREALHKAETSLVNPSTPEPQLLQSTPTRTGDIDYSDALALIQSDPDLVTSSGERVLVTKSGWSLNLLYRGKFIMSLNRGVSKSGVTKWGSDCSVVTFVTLAPRAGVAGEREQRFLKYRVAQSDNLAADRAVILNKTCNEKSAYSLALFDPLSYNLHCLLPLSLKHNNGGVIQTRSERKG